MKWLLSVVAALLLAGCMTPAQRGDGLDAIARDYVGLSLEIGTHEEGYVDAYYGPAEWKQAAEANPRTVPALAAVAADLQARLRATPAPADLLVQRRRAFLDAQLTAARTRLRMIAGE